VFEAFTRPRFGAGSPLMKLARGGAIAGTIKLVGAALAFLMFLAVSMVTDARQFGLFGAAFAAASLVSFFSTIGQQSVILRFWPEHMGRNDRPAARALMALSVRVAAIGAIVGALLLVIAGFLPIGGSGMPEWLPLCLAAGLLALGLGWSEFIAAAMRAQGSITRALLPRDIIWRGLVIGVALVLHAAGVRLSAVEATLLTGLLLLLPVLPQTIVLMVRSELRGSPKVTPEQQREFTHITWGLWGVNALPPALAQATTLLVALILGPEIAGAVFVAERSARLVEVAQSGINQVLAPEIAATYHTGRKEHVQRIVALAALAGTLVAIGALAVFGLAGELILSLFDQEYATSEYALVLVTFAAGTAVGCACGPVGVLLQLTGAQHALLRLQTIGYPLGLLATALLALAWGPIGAGLGSAAAWAGVCVAAVFLARRRLGIDPSIFGLFGRPAQS
jgi:O-antigen/teichoic acid export membrane protein